MKDNSTDLIDLVFSSPEEGLSLLAERANASLQNEQLERPGVVKDASSIRIPSLYPGTAYIG